MNELISELTGKLGVSEHQAKGGVGMLLKLAKEHLGGNDAAELREAIPDADKMEAEAPDEDAAGGGLMGALGGIAGSLGGEKVGALAGLAGGFSKLGLDAGDVQKFLPILTGFLEGKGKGGLVQKVMGLLG
jgi:hypothetical protein